MSQESKKAASMDISKYRFIPPSKLLKNKPVNSEIAHCHSVTEHSPLEM